MKLEATYVTSRLRSWAEAAGCGLASERGGEPGGHRVRRSLCHFEHLGSLLIKPTRLMFIVAWNRHNHFPLARRRFGEEVCMPQAAINVPVDFVPGSGCAEPRMGCTVGFPERERLV